MRRHSLKVLVVPAVLNISISNAAYVGTWTTESGQWKYRQDDGTYTKGRFQNTDGRWYYSDANGWILSNTAAPDGYQVGEGGVRVNHDSHVLYDTDYPPKDYADKAGLQCMDVIMDYNSKGNSVMERRLRQDYNYGLYNYFGPPDSPCKALYGKSDQVGTGEMAVDGDSLLVLAGVPLYQEGAGNDTYKQQRSRIALAIRGYLNSHQWKNASELERAGNIASYIASSCIYDEDLYSQLVAGEDITGDPFFTAYGCPVNHEAMCEGISIVYQSLARSVGLDCSCILDGEDKDYMFVYVRADRNWYRVDLSVTGPAPQATVRRCLTDMANQEVKRTMKTYYSEENPHIKHTQYDSLAPGAVYQLKGGRQYREYQ